MNKFQQGSLYDEIFQDFPNLKLDLSDFLICFERLRVIFLLIAKSKEDAKLLSSFYVLRAL